MRENMKNRLAARASCILRFASIGLVCAMSVPANAQPAERPNILVLLVDDAALMDLEPYGGEASTPNINALAERGTLFTRFRASPLCSTTRAMLLTGLDNHQAGLGTIREVIPPELEGRKGYSLALEPGVKTIATRLNDAQYRTYMTGKWHLGHGQNNLPADHGFDRSFVLAASGADNWEDKTFMPLYEQADWFDGRDEAALPEDYYSSKFLIDQMIEYLEADQGNAKPFFAYIGFLAVHVPIQAPREYTKKYISTYESGWETTKSSRWQRAQELGLIPRGAAVAPFPEGARSWDSLSTKERNLYTKSMAVNAGMLEAMDFHIGRLVSHLEQTGALDNTIIIVTSDNGPEYNDPAIDPLFQLYMATHGYTQEVENLGEKGSFGSIGTEWATAAAGPFSRFKFNTTEGGTRVPLIISGPGVPSGGRVNADAFMPDIAPTLMQYAEISYGDGEFFGRSLNGVITGETEQVYGPDDAVGMEVAGNAALFRGNWKLARNHKPWGTGDWQLFNLEADPGETDDLFSTRSDVANEMLAEYEDYAAKVGVVQLPDGYNPSEQLRLNTQKVMIERHGQTLLLMAGSLVLLISLGIYILRRRRRKSLEARVMQ